MKKIQKNSVYILILFSIILFHFINNAYWLRQDGVSGGCDVYIHLNLEVDFYHKLSNTIANEQLTIFEKLRDIFTLLRPPGAFRPRFVYLITGIFNILFGLSDDIIRLSNMFFFCILLISVYLIGKFIADGKSALFSSFIVSMYPGIFGISRKYGLDFPLVAMVSLGIYLLLRSDNFKNTKYSLLFGLVSALSFATKAQYLLFIIGPVLFCCCKIISDANHFKQDREKFLITLLGRLRNLIITFFILAIVSYCFFGGGKLWLNNLRALWRDFVVHLIICYLPREMTYRPYFFQNELWQCTTIFKWLTLYLCQTITHISFLFFIVFCIGLIYFIKSKFIKEKSILLLWIIIPYVIFTIISVKLERYYFPAFPSLALVSAIGILKIPRKTVRIRLSTLIVTIALLQFFILSYGIKTYWKVLGVKKDEIFKHSIFLKPICYTMWCHPPRQFNHEPPVSRLVGNIKNDDLEPVIGILASQEAQEMYPNYYFWRYLIKLKMPYALVYSILKQPKKPCSSEFFNEYEKFNFYFILTKRRWDEYGENLIKFRSALKKLYFENQKDLNLLDTKIKAEKKIEEWVDDFSQFYLIGKDTIYPEKINIYLFKRKL